MACAFGRQCLPGSLGSVDLDVPHPGGSIRPEGECNGALRAVTFACRLLFSTEKSLSTEEIVTLYNKDKAQIEYDFRLIKSPDVLRFSPIRHFTDTKIRIYGFICVIALMAFKLMQFRTRELGLSADALVTELKDIQEIVLIYSVSRARRTISECSTIQRRLLDIFELQRFLPAD